VFNKVSSTFNSIEWEHLKASFEAEEDDDSKMTMDIKPF
jgi:hypothetical protein